MTAQDALADLKKICTRLEFLVVYAQPLAHSSLTKKETQTAIKDFTTEIEGDLLAEMDDFCRRWCEFRRL